MKKIKIFLAKVLNLSVSDFMGREVAYMKGFMEGIDNNYDHSSVEDLGESINKQVIELGQEIGN